MNNSNSIKLIEEFDIEIELTVEHDLVMVVDMFYMVHHLLKNNVVREMNLMLHHE
jgi:hypothetical protein